MSGKVSTLCKFCKQTCKGMYIAMDPKKVADTCYFMATIKAANGEEGVDSNK